jgi:hypothetical protein
MARPCGVAENCRQTIGSGRGETLTFPSCWCASSATNRSREGAGKVGFVAAAKFEAGAPQSKQVLATLTQQFLILPHL